MTAIWENSGEGWALLPPSGFPDEVTLHNLVADAPHVLPLSGSPRLVIVGREVTMGGGSADLVAVEPDGRVAIIEIKLKRNSEARRAVVAQVLSYAAALTGLESDTFEKGVLGRHLEERGFSSLVEAVESSPDGIVDRYGFGVGLDECLRAGAFRLVLVLDDAPADLVKLIGYLEAKTHGLVIDLITVSAHSVGDSQLVVPRRVEPARETSEAPKRVGAVATARVVITEGSADFRSSIATTSAEHRDALTRLADWADELEREGLARLSTNHDPRGWKVLRVWLPGQDRGIVTLWNDGSVSVQIWGSVLARVAPESLEPIQAASGLELSAAGSKSTREVSNALLGVLAEAYRSATLRPRARYDWSRAIAVVEAMPGDSWTSYGDLAEFLGTGAQAVAGWAANAAPRAACRILGDDGKPRAGFRWADPRETRDVRDVLADEGVRFDASGRADDAQRLRATELAKLLG